MSGLTPLPDTLTMTSFPFDKAHHGGHVGEFFLMEIAPDGGVSIDGGHSSLEGVARARELYGRLFSKPGFKYAAFQVVEIPDGSVPVNEEAIAILTPVLQDYRDAARMQPGLRKRVRAGRLEKQEQGLW